MEVTTEARKVEAESAYQWKQTKHLLKYIRNQERDVARTERYDCVSTGVRLTQCSPWNTY